MRLTREQSREQTRERLIEAARSCIMAQGYEGTSIGDIAEAAGFTKGAFFSNFDSKEALLLEMLRRHKAEQVDEMRQVLDTSDSSPDAMPALGRYIDTLDSDCGWLLLDIELELQATRNPAFAERYTAIERDFRDAIGGLIASLFARGGRALPAHPQQVAGTVIALVRGLVLASRADPAHPPVSGQVHLVLKALLAASAPL